MVDDHVDDEALETFLLDAATPNQVERIERHLLICPTCVDAAQKAQAYIGGMRKAFGAESPAST